MKLIFLILAIIVLTKFTISHNYQKLYDAEFFALYSDRKIENEEVNIYFTEKTIIMKTTSEISIPIHHDKVICPSVESNAQHGEKENPSYCYEIYYKVLKVGFYKSDSEGYLELLLIFKNEANEYDSIELRSININNDPKMFERFAHFARVFLNEKITQPFSATINKIELVNKWTFNNKFKVKGWEVLCFTYNYLVLKRDRTTKSSTSSFKHYFTPILGTEYYFVNLIQQEKNLRVYREPGYVVLQFKTQYNEDRERKKIRFYFKVKYEMSKSGTGGEKVLEIFQKFR
jgi:hypothetical protein